MKASRVYTTTAVVCVLLIGFFFLPLPLSRVRDTGMIVVDPNSSESVALEEPARLMELSADIRPGVLVSKGQPLGLFKNDELDLEIDRMTNFRDGQRLSAKQYGAAIAGNRSEGNEAAAKRNMVEARLAMEKATTAQNGLDRLIARREAISKLKAPRDGVLIAAPSPDERGKLFDRGFSEAPPLFSVGDPSKLMIRVPVSPPDYRLLSDDLAERKELDVSIYVKGRTDREFHGKVRSLPPQNADTVPIQLTQRGGGPLAVKPGGDPNILQPLAQVYLVDVEIVDADLAVDPGQLANVKIHTKWRSGAWWLGRTIANAFDLGLY